MQLAILSPGTNVLIERFLWSERCSDAFELRIRFIKFETLFRPKV